ncbi:hypothetical protein BX070DRAFT_226292 [Coemansia spiralis]|nr:hypothetical protein BX070DRAFT_226292 [Coemansia spiralis]
MGIFWPPTNFPHIVRLLGLLGLVAGCCAIADPETRYSLMRYLYSQLKRLDERAAQDIESKLDKNYLNQLIRQSAPNNAKDTRSFASDSTAFSRVPSPTQVNEADVSRLGEALSRLQLAVGSGKVLGELDYNPAVQASAVNPERAVTGDEVLFPLTTANGPQTPQASQTPQTEPVSKKVDTSDRLTPLPNPNAPTVQPTMRDGRPQPFSYPSPSDGKLRKERAHVQIETVDDHSYGFVSNPAAFVSSPTSQQQPAQDADHYLFVCVKCHRQSTNEVCEKICSDEDGVLRCKLRPRDGRLVDDMEDLVMPMTPKMYTDGRRKTTGRMLYENLRALHTQHEHMKERAACHGSADSAVRDCPNAVKSRLRIVPVNCLSMCHLGNVIAVSAPGKFSYQFGAMHENDSEDMQAILQFAEDYIESPEGFTKNKTRPPRLSRNILSRIPPPLPSFTSITE